jgi:hypothetical protein
MNRASNSIGVLASALAKAQVELTNPEKSLVALLPPLPGTAERSFRYAPLSSGLEIIRKAFGKHDIATIQTTAIDASSGLVQLTTTLAHKSGEWISSDWPVCVIADAAQPQRMGAALTYARRYALFTLAGIAGDDDLDAPGMMNPPIGDVRPSAVQISAAVHRRARRITPVRHRASDAAAASSALSAQDSARLRKAMLSEIRTLDSLASAERWAASMMDTKNRLLREDSREVETAFSSVLSQLSADMPAVQELNVDAPSVRSGASDNAAPLNPASEDAANALPSSRRSLPKTTRHRNKEHLKFVQAQPCLVCGRNPSDPHHLRFAQPQALGRKVSDEFTVPLCRTHHREAHRASQELQWWQSKGLAPMEAARTLWSKTQGRPPATPHDSRSSGEAALHQV